MSTNVNKPMFSDRYGKDIRKPDNTVSKRGNTLGNAKPFESPYDGPPVALEGNQKTGLNERNYFGKSRMNTNNFKEFNDETSKTTNEKMYVVITISILFLVTIVASIFALLV